MGDVITRTSAAGEKLFYLRFVDLDGKRACIAAKHPDDSRARTLRDATRLLHDAEAAVRRGVKVAKEKQTEDEKRKQTITIRELAVRFVEEVRPIPKKGYKHTPRVIKAYRQCCRSMLKCHWLDGIGDRPAASIEPGELEKIRDALLDKFADDSVGKAMGVLSRLYAWALREKLITCASPLAGLARPKDTAGCPDYLTDAQVGTLIEWLEQNGEPMLLTMVVLGVFTGVRKGEMLGMRWSDVHTDLKRLDVERSYDGPTKNGVIDSIKLNEAAIPILNRWRNVCPKTADDLVFPVHAGAGRYRMGHHRDMLDLHRALLKALGRTWDRPWHLLRHSFASALVRRGVPLYTVGKLLRDKNPQVVMRYAKLSPEHLATEVDRLSFPAPTVAGVTDLAAARARREVDTTVDTSATDSPQPTAITGE
jgi:integrase